MAGRGKDVKNHDYQIFRGYNASNKAKKDLIGDRDEDEEGIGAAFDSQEMDAMLTGATNVPSRNIPFHKAGKLNCIICHVCTAGLLVFIYLVIQSSSVARAFPGGK